MSFEKKLNSLKKKSKIKNKNKLGLSFCKKKMSVLFHQQSAWLKFQTFIWLNDSLLFRFCETKSVNPSTQLWKTDDKMFWIKSQNDC